MGRSRPIRRRSLIALILAALALPAAAFAERLPVRIYTTADGLASDRVRRIFRDSRGFLWFCATGLSRFDGVRFTNYAEEDGLPMSVTDMLETRRGDYWVATNGGGIARFEPRRLIGGDGVPMKRFTAVPVGDTAATNRVNVLYEDRAGTVWIGTDGRIFTLDAAGHTHEALQQFHRAFSPFEHLSVIVAQELRAGVQRPRDRKALERNVLEVFQRASRQSRRRPMPGTDPAI